MPKTSLALILVHQQHVHKFLLGSNSQLSSVYFVSMLFRCCFRRRLMPKPGWVFLQLYDNTWNLLNKAIGIRFELKHEIIFLYFSLDQWMSIVYLSSIMRRYCFQQQKLTKAKCARLLSIHKTWCRCCYWNKMPEHFIQINE